MTKLYTIGEIYRLGLLKNHKGEPYKDKSTVAKIVATLGFVTKKTPWGTAKCLTKDQIELYNKDRKQQI